VTITNVKEHPVPNTDRQARMPRSALPTQMPSDFAVVFWVAFAVSTLIVVGQIAFILSVTPAVMRVADQAGRALPPILATVRALGPLGIFFSFAIGDALVFAVFALLARRYWIGLLFVPPMLYLAGAFVALWVFVTQVAFAG